MIQVRNEVFETNSSSAHTIAIKKNDEYDYDLGWYVDDNGTFELWRTELEFGRTPFDILTETKEKLPYFICAFGFKKISRIILENVSEVKQIKKPCLTQWDYKDLKGGIDHQSAGMLEHFIKKHNLTIEEALFNTKYIIIIDGDEYNIWDKMVRENIINKEIFDDTGTE